jgi:hydroxymethylpyrimidine/phosphomethylpyrimidine kinase
VSSPHVVLSIAGTDSGGAAGLAADCEVLLPRCAVVTPNLDEAARLTGLDLPSAVRLTQAFVEAALTVSASWDLGRGRGPVAHVFTHHP